MKKITLFFLLLLLNACGGGSGGSGSPTDPQGPSTLEQKKKCLLEAGEGTSFLETNPSNKELLIDSLKLALKCNVSEADMRQFLSTTSIY